MLREWTPLKKILLIFVASILAGLLFVDFYLQRALESTALESWNIDQRALADSISELIDFQLAEALHDLQLVAATPAFSELPFVDRIDRAINGLPEHLDRPKRELLEILRSRFSVLFVLLPNGDHYLSHPFSVQRRLQKYNLADRPYVQQAARSGQPVVSNSFYGADGVLAVAMDVPVTDARGRTVLHLGGVLHLTRLAQLVKKERIGRFDSAFIVDRRGALIAHTDPKLLVAEAGAVLFEHPLVAFFLKARKEGFGPDQGVVEFSDPSAGDTLGTVVPLRFGWGLVLLRHKDALHREIQPQQREMLLLVAVILIAIGAVGAPFVRHIGKGWESAEQEVQRSRDRLEARVAERTAQLRQSEGRIHAIIDNTTSLIFLKDLRGNYLLVNRSFEELFGLTKQEIIGKNDYDLFPEVIARQLQANDLQALTRSKAIEFEEQVPQEECVRHYVSVKFPLADETGKIYAVGGVSTDITARKHAEEERKQLDRLKDEFMATAAHELRTPLTAVLGYSELLMSEQKLEPELVRECLSTICRKSRSLQKLIDQLFDLSRVASERQLRLEKQSFDCAAEIRQLVEECRRANGQYRFAVQHPAGPLPLFADKDRFRQVMENLLGNAVKFSAAGCLIEVTVRMVDGAAEVSVRDEGSGIPPEQAGKVFEKFYRVDSSSTGKQGLGLGLALSKSIVEAHGGRIWLESEEGRGTRVTFSLPLV
jgi:PAS domain S-box-containing protein